MTRRIVEYIYSNVDFLERYKKVKSKNWREIYATAYFNRWIEPPKTIIRDWQKDEEFCRQLIQGVNPMVIKKVTTKTPLSDELRELTSNGRTVDEMIKEGCLFVADYELLDGFSLHANMFFYAPIVLLENTKDGLQILGIQLTRDKHCKNEIHSPDTARTHPNRYLFAKIHVACADIQVHEFVYHLGFTHLAMEPFAIAQYNVWTQRFPDHKLGHLMEPHFKDTIGINYLARVSLVGQRYALTDQTFSIGTDEALKMIVKAWNRWDFHGNSFPEDLRSRGFSEDGSDGLRNFYFRDDGFKIWHAIKEYVAIVVHETYNSDKSVAADSAVRAWYEELRDPKRANIPSFPKLETRDDLIEAITNIIFTASAQHSAVNYSQLPYITYVPNRPDSLFRPMPAKQLEDVTDDYISSALPNVLVSHFQVSFTYLLTTPPEQPDLLSELSATRDVFPKAHKRLMERLKKISAEISKRNDALVKEGKTPYPWLQPDMINMSVAI
jgi:arachidonate 5-lipoxygenase